MTETILALVPVYGLALIAVATFLSCLAVPMPASLVMLSAGALPRRAIWCCGRPRLPRLAEQCWVIKRAIFWGGRAHA